jgi:hypothetical protein
MVPVIDVLIFLTVALAAIAAVYFFRRIVVGGRELVKLSGNMLVTCPETRKPAAVKVASGRAAAAAVVGRQHVELKSCSRWPQRDDCDQACLGELILDPASHAVWMIAAKWYQGKSCAFCGRPISPLSHLDHAPGLIAYDGQIIEWPRLEPESLPQAFESARPVCWNCTVVESFRKEHPELVVERPGNRKY